LTDTVRIEIPENSEFPLENLPLGIGAREGERPRAWVALGNDAVDLAALERAGYLEDIGLPTGCFVGSDLNRFLETGPTAWRLLRQRLRQVLSSSLDGSLVVAQIDLVMGVPVTPVDYVDFYSSLHHAKNLGRIFRPDGEALLDNWRRIPVGYHGRTGTLVPTNTDIRRPHGVRLVDGDPVFGASKSVDIELEVGTVVGVGSEIGAPIAVGDAAGHLYGMCLVNDWSARDIQAFEYQPLGPFLGKSFATSVGPWLISFEALAPHRVRPAEQDPPVSEYLRATEPWGFDLQLEVWLQSAAMRSRGLEPVRLSETGFGDMYWTPAQQLAHLTVNGASTSPGDLFASGTVSGPHPGSEGSLIEMSANGACPIKLPDGATRTFLEDGDRVVLRGWAGGGDVPRIGFGELAGTIAGAIGGD